MPFEIRNLPSCDRTQTVTNHLSLMLTFQNLRFIYLPLLHEIQIYRLDKGLRTYDKFQRLVHGILFAKFFDPRAIKRTWIELIK